MSSGFWFIKIYPDKQIQQLHPENKHVRPKIRLHRTNFKRQRDSLRVVDWSLEGGTGLDNQIL